MGFDADSSCPRAMPAEYVAYDDLPWADGQVIRAHAAELIAMAESLGLADLRYASSNRIVVRRTDHVEPMGEHRFSERATSLSRRSGLTTVGRPTAASIG